MEWLLGKAAMAQLTAWTGLSPSALGKIAYTMAIIAAYLLVTRAVRVLFTRRVEADLRYRLNKSATHIVGFLAALALLKVWLLGTVNVVTYLGIVSAGLAIALQDPITNLAGWLFIIWRQPFKVGDRVQLGEHIGDVVDTRMFSFSMLEVGNWVDADQSTGRILHIPNGRVFKQPCGNYTQGFEFIWHEIPVVVTFESDWKAAHEILTEIVNRDAAKVGKVVAEQMADTALKYKMQFKHLTPIVWLEVVDIGVNLTMRFLCPVRARRSTSDRLWRAVLAEFGQRDDIDFAYPTQRLYANFREGKPDAGGPAKPDGATAAAPAPPLGL